MKTPIPARTSLLATGAVLLAACLAWLIPSPAAQASAPSFAGFGSGGLTADPGDGVATGPIRVCPVGRPCDAATHGYATNEFSPQFSASASTLEAGAHPDLTLGFSRSPYHCVGELPGEADPNTDGDGFSNTCKESELRFEQDLRRVSFSLPTGMKLELDGVPYCDSYWDWLTVNPDPDFLLKVHQEFCGNPDAQVGSVHIATTSCGPWNHQDQVTCILPLFGGEEPGLWVDEPGVVYNESPRPGEDGHLVVLYPGDPGRPTLNNFMRFDFSVNEKGGDRVELVADPFPVIGGEGRDVIWYADPVRHPSAELPIQPAAFTLTLYGAGQSPAGGLSQPHVYPHGTAGEPGRPPLLTNPTACAPREIRAELQGYAVNAWSDWWAAFDPVYGTQIPAGRPGLGEGRGIVDAIPYEVSNCDNEPSGPGDPPSGEQPGGQEPPDSGDRPSPAAGNGQAPAGQPSVEGRVDGDRPGGNARLRLAVRSPAEPIAELRFDVAGKLNWALRHRARRDNAAHHKDASVSFVSPHGTLRALLKAQAKATPASRDSLRFTPVGSRRGRASSPQLRRFSTLLSHQGAGRGDNAASTIALRGLPRRKPSEVSLVLGGHGSSLVLRAPEACGKSLAVTAVIKTVGGRTFQAETRLRIAGKACRAKAGARRRADRESASKGQAH